MTDIEERMDGLETMMKGVLNNQNTMGKEIDELNKTLKSLKLVL
jgi:archaellum component FlaC